MDCVSSVAGAELTPAAGMLSLPDRPELAGAFEATLILAAGRFNGSGTQRFVGFETLRGSGCPLLTGLWGLNDLTVTHPVLVISK